MKDAEGRTFQIGDLVSVPINGEELHDNQICETFEVVVALRHKDGRFIYPINEMGYIINQNDQ